MDEFRYLPGIWTDLVVGSLAIPRRYHPSCVTHASQSGFHQAYWNESHCAIASLTAVTFEMPIPTVDLWLQRQALQHPVRPRGFLFDLFIELRERRERDRQAERLRGLQVDNQLKCRGLSDQQISGFRALEDLIDEEGEPPVRTPLIAESLSMLAGELALTIAAVFTGAAVYISVAEQPARLQLDNRSLLAEWRPAYRRGYVMQTSLAIIGGLFGLLAYLSALDWRWPLGAIVLLATGRTRCS